MEHTKAEPFIVGALGDSPQQAATRHGWPLERTPARRRPRTVIARGKAGLYHIVSGPTGCKAYPVAS